MTCNNAQVSCPNTQNLEFTYASLNPVGIAPGINTAKGVIVFFNGTGGTEPSGNSYATSYFNSGYVIVQIAWMNDWEYTYSPFPTGTYGSIQNAACRPATFLNFIYTNIFQPVLNANSGAGYCAQGVSAGSAQIAYSLAYYGAGSWLDNVELTSGPVFGDISQGCQYPAASNVTVCGANSGNQFGCQLGGGGTWSLAPTYVGGDVAVVVNWTNDATCADYNGSGRTSQAAMSRWLAQSIVDQENVTGLGAAPSYSYPGTGLSAWLCRSVWQPPSPWNCQENYNSNFCGNNSSTQGQIFYANITSANSPSHYDLYAVDSCTGAEGVDGTYSNVPGFYPSIFGTNGQIPSIISGFTAIQYDMVGYVRSGVQLVTAQCFRRQH